MALYSIESEQCLGMSHHGAVTVNGESAVELSDEEVNILVQLIKETGTTDVDELGIATTHPDLYEKLDDAYRNMAYKAEELHWLWEGYHNGYFEYDTEELMNYCGQELGFSFESDETDCDSDDVEEEKYDAFYEWLDDYVNELSDDEAASFFYNHMNASLDMDYVEYSVEIPAGIIKKSQEVC